MSTPKKAIEILRDPQMPLTETSLANALWIKSNPRITQDQAKEIIDVMRNLFHYKMKTAEVGCAFWNVIPHMTCYKKITKKGNITIEAKYTKDKNYVIDYSNVDVVDNSMYAPTHTITATDLAREIWLKCSKLNSDDAYKIVKEINRLYLIKCNLCTPTYSFWVIRGVISCSVFINDNMQMRVAGKFPRAIIKSLQDV